jgi:hypothetical protein
LAADLAQLLISTAIKSTQVERRQRYFWGRWTFRRG